MASSYSDLGLELMVTGENAGTWGDKTNSNLNLIQQSVAGYEAVALSDGGTVTLAMTDATLSNARNMVIKFTGTLTTASTVTIPDGIEKFYIFDCSAVVGPTNLTIKTVSGTGFTLNAAKIFAAYSDGTNLNEISLDTLGGTIAAADITGTISNAQIADNAVTTAKISNVNVTNAKIADNAITTAKISNNQVTAAKIADDAVGPDQLENTAVTPAEYTSATVTVDAQGRITAASSGAGGAGAFVPKIVSTGPASGTYTANVATNYVGAYMYAGGGGGGGGYNPGPNSFGGAGGPGGFGFYGAAVSSPFSQPYSVGGAGNGGAAYTGNGNAGGATTIATIGTVNGGGGGNRASPGSDPGNTGSTGSAPGANLATYRGFLVGQPSASAQFGTGGSGGNAQQSGSAGNKGVLALFENIGS